jgi:long-chain acyl-CoA synthetase
MGPLGPEEAYIAYLPLAHVLELLAENVMLVLGIPIGYATTNTLLDNSTMVARGSKVSRAVFKGQCQQIFDLLFFFIKQTYLGL